MTSCSPRTRGWSRHVGEVVQHDVLLPAHAGMVPITTEQVTAGRRCSPRTRGWSPGRLPPARHALLLPAHAGMVPTTRPVSRSGASAPRARGDGPGRLRGGHPRVGCSPRTRGWSREPAGRPRHRPLLPAHAGMVPASPVCPPRLRAAPRARGDGPFMALAQKKEQLCSPRTRGWSPAARQSGGARPLLPAHAGMVPAGSPRRRPSRSAPRARGDGPKAEIKNVGKNGCSPRTRGMASGSRGSGSCVSVVSFAFRGHPF